MATTSIITLPIVNWQPDNDTGLQEEAITSLENGSVLYLPSLAFEMDEVEQSYLRPNAVDERTKTIKFSHGQDRLWGQAANEGDALPLKAMLRRYAESAQQLFSALFPHYGSSLILGNTSFRPVAAEGRIQSARHDDSRLHVDAFPSRPNGGSRLLRLFTNIDPQGRPRIWRVGEPFPQVANQFLPKIPAPIPGSAGLLKLLHITKGKRTAYDHYMLQLHDRMKLDPDYQTQASQQRVEFAAGSSWIVFSDQVSHAAMAGQHMLEQTFTLPVAAMKSPETSPFYIINQLIKVAS